MSDRSDSSLVHDIDVTYERLRNSAFIALPPDARRDLADKADGIIQSLWSRLDAECRRRIIDDRAANSGRRDQDIEARSITEAELWTQTLLQLLPAAQTLLNAQLLAEQTRHGRGFTTAKLGTSGTAAVDAGLQAFAAGNFAEALRTWARADSPDVLVRTVVAQRQTLAAELIEQANMACDVIRDLDSPRLRREARDTVYHKALNPVERIGTEKQRDQAMWVHDELESIFAQPDGPPTTPKATPAATIKPPRPGRRVFWVTLALLLALGGVWFAFAQGGGDAVEGQPTPASASTSVAVAASAAPATATGGTNGEATATAAPVGTRRLAPTTTRELAATPTTRLETTPTSNIATANAATAQALLVAPPTVTPLATPTAESTTIVPADPTIPATSETNGPPLVGRVAFTSNRTGNDDIFVADAAGGEQRNVTAHPARDSAPDWSPDGSQLVFVSDRDGGIEQLFIINVDGSGLRQLTTGNGRKFSPTWSPDGENILFESDGEIYLARANSGTLLRLSENNVVDTAPRWSPDSQRVVYSSFRTGNFEIFYTDAVGSQFTRVTVDDAADLGPAWSPDGNTIAFLSDRTGRQTIFLMNADGSNVRPIETPLPDIQSVDWSPDGRSLVFDAFEPGQSRVYTINVDGTGLSQLSLATTFDGEPAWGPPANMMGD